MLRTTSLERDEERMIETMEQINRDDGANQAVHDESKTSRTASLSLLRLVSFGVTNLDMRYHRLFELLALSLPGVEPAELIPVWSVNLNLCGCCLVALLI